MSAPAASAVPAPVAPPAPLDWVDDLFRQADAARRAGRLRLAMAMVERVVAARPDHFLAVQHLGAFCTIFGRRREAAEVLRRALALRPDEPTARHALGMTLMALGRFEEATPYYEARFEVPQLRLAKPVGLPFPEWRGEALAGKRLLVVGEMGFGDQIQHARFLRLLRERGARVVYACRPQLVSLMAESLPDVEVLSSEGRVDFGPDPDFWAMSGSLMGQFGVTPQTLPNAPCLRAPAPATLLPPGFKVGLKTAGDPSHGNDANRSLAPEQAQALRAALPGQVVDLAPEATGARDFAETAAIMGQLDLVISVDTSVAHLAGALGKRGFVLIPSINTDWRWMHDREDSPWYPSLRLYRSDPYAGWAPALERLVRDARALAERS